MAVLNADSGEVVRFIGSDEVGPGHLHWPKGLALRTAPLGVGAQSLLYVSNNLTHCIQVFDAETGAYIRTIGEGPGNGVGELAHPHGIALQESPPGSGEPCLLYVADWDNERVQVFDADSGAHVCMIGDGEGEDAAVRLMSVTGVALHPGADDSMLLVVTDKAHVQVFVV